MPKVTCPACGVRDDTSGSGSFEVRGQLQGMPVRKCLNCGAGMTIVPSLRGAKPRLIEDDLWRRMELLWQEEVGRSAAGGWARGDEPPDDHNEPDNHGDEPPDDDEEADDEEPDRGTAIPSLATCVACGSTGTTDAQSTTFHFRGPYLDRPVRVCATCGRWLFLVRGSAGETEIVPDHLAELLVTMHQVLRPGVDEADVRRGRVFDSEEDAEDFDELASDALDAAPPITTADTGLPASVGDAVVVPFDDYAETNLRVTLERFGDFVEVNGFAASDDDPKYIAFFLVENVSPLTFKDTLTNVDLVINGRTDTGAANEFYGEVTLPPRKSIRGYVTFDIDGTSSPVAVRFTAGWSGGTAEWTLR